MTSFQDLHHLQSQQSSTIPAALQLNFQDSLALPQRLLEDLTVLPTSKRRVIFQFMNRPEFITRDSRIIISENNLKIVGLVTDPMFDTDKNLKLFNGAATPQTEKKKRRMSNQPSDLYPIQSVSGGQESGKANANMG